MGRRAISSSITGGRESSLKKDSIPEKKGIESKRERENKFHGKKNIQEAKERMYPKSPSTVSSSKKLEERV